MSDHEQFQYRTTKDFFSNQQTPFKTTQRLSLKRDASLPPISSSIAPTELLNRNPSMPLALSKSNKL